jgi:hypothetical protein
MLLAVYSDAAYPASRDPRLSLVTGHLPSLSKSANDAADILGKNVVKWCDMCIDGNWLLPSGFN